MRPPDISIRIYQPYLVSSKNTPQKLCINVMIIKCEKNVNPGGEGVLMNLSYM